MRTKISKYEPLFQEIKKNLPPAFSNRAISTEIERVVKNKAIKAGIKRLVTKRIRQIEYRPIKGISPQTLFTFEKDVDGLDLAYGFISEKRYFSNLSAIYLLGLTNQRPLVHYVCLERPDRPNSSFVYDEDLAKLEFRKKERISKRYIRHKETEIYIVEKQNLGMVGVVSVPIKKKDKKVFYTRCTSLERTFIDSIVTPHYSGGVESITSFFKNTDLNLRELKKIYQKLNPLYPYWQRIGYVLDVMNQKEKSKKWREYFKNVDLKKFFISKGYRSDWSFNKKWKMYHPESML